jgi:quercetin dioxygenase-like cupin family protein
MTTTVAPEGAKDGYLLGKDEGEAHWLLGMLEIVKISGADTGGAYGLLEVTVRAGEGSPWHVHPDEDEWFYVLEGEFTVYVGERRLSLPAGAFAFGPKGVPHTFIAETDGAKALIGFQPFHFEGFLREVGEPATRRPPARPPPSSHDPLHAQRHHRPVPLRALQHQALLRRHPREDQLRSHQPTRTRARMTLRSLL